MQHINILCFFLLSRRIKILTTAAKVHWEMQLVHLLHSRLFNTIAVAAPTIEAVTQTATCVQEKVWYNAYRQTKFNRKTHLCIAVRMMITIKNSLQYLTLLFSKCQSLFLIIWWTNSTRWKPRSWTDVIERVGAVCWRLRHRAYFQFRVWTIYF